MVIFSTVLYLYKRPCWRPPGIPLAKQVKRTIAQQLSQITGHTERQQLELIEKPKSKQTHFSLSVPLIWRSATARLKPVATLDATNSDPKSTLSIGRGEKLDAVSATGSSSPLEYANELAKRVRLIRTISFIHDRVARKLTLFASQLFTSFVFV